MADTKISALTSATAPLAGTEVAPIVQSSTTKKATVEQIATATQPSGTANGVMYLNGSKTPTTGSTFNFNGSQLGFGVAGSSAYGFRQIYTGSGATSQYGMYLDSYGDSSATANIVSIRAKARTSAASFTCGTAACINADTISAGAGSTITNAIGIILADQTAGGTNYGLASYVTSGSNKWNLYISGTASNYFNGGINVGSTADPGAGNLSLTGNVIQGTAAKGVNFTANTPAAGMTSQLLNWYEQGTWTPSIANSFNNYTHTIQVGRYTRVGNLVTVQFTIAWTTTNAGGFSFAVEGLPFTPVTLTNYASGGSIGKIDRLTTTKQVMCQVESATASVKFYELNTGAAATALASASWNTAGSANLVSGTVTYQV